MQSLSYGEFSAGFHDRVVSRRIPVEGIIEVTRRCPMNCLHCYNNLPLGDAAARAGELSYEEHCRILDEISEAGCLWLLYTGGEIFARRDFLAIYTYAKKKGLLITLFTNGTLITPGIADYLAQWVPFSIEISLYGRTQETHDRLTRTPGSFEACLRGIRLLRERGLPLKIKTMVVSTNQRELGDMKRFVHEDLGLSFRFDCLINARLDCSTGPLSVRLEPSEAVRLDLLDPEWVAEWKKFACESMGRSQGWVSNEELYQCGGGVSSFAISPEGRLNLCVLDPADSYNLRKGSFQDGWENYLHEIRGRKITRQTKCINCGIQPMCGMCPAIGRLECRDPETPVEFYCHVAHLRSYALGISVPRHGDCEYCEGGSRYDELRLLAGGLAQSNVGDRRAFDS